MITEQNQTFALIQDGVVSWTFTSNELPEYNETQINTVNITGQAVVEGDLYDGTNFSKPAAVALTERDFTLYVQSVLDSKAQEKGYDNIVSACSYAAGVNPFQAEGLKFLEWRAAVWTKCYEVLAEVNANTRPVPSVEELIAELPSYVE